MTVLRNYRRWVGCGLLTTLLGTSGGLVAGPIGIPDSARPGALRPEAIDRDRLPKEAAEPVMDVPAMIDRPLGVEEGPRVEVTRFELVGANDWPQYDIAVAEIEAILEDQRRARPEGFTIGLLDEMTAEITNYYRARGLILARVVIPVQTVEDDGVVTVEVIEGRLGRVLAEDNQMYRESILEKPFRPLIGRPVHKDEIESALLTLTDFPGLTVFGVFQPGLKIGESDLVLKVQKEDRFDFALRVDNHGTPETGLNRGRLTVDWNNITGGADKLTLTTQRSINPTNSKFASADYERYLGRGFRIGGFITRNTFDVGGEFKDRRIAAETDNQGLYIDKTFIRSRERNLSTRLGLTLKDSRTTIQDEQVNEDHLTVLSFQLQYDSVDTRFSGLNFASLEYNRGFNDIFGAMGSPASALERDRDDRPSRQGGFPNRDFAAGQFDKLFGSYSRLQTVTRNSSFLFRSEFQYSDDILIPVEQYAIGGPDNVRAYGPAEALFDQAMLLSGEFIINAPFFADKDAFANRTWGELLQVSLFYDIAAGKLNEPLPTEPQHFEPYQGAGWGLRFNLPGSVESRFLMAWPLGNPPAANGRSRQIWADFTWRF